MSNAVEFYKQGYNCSESILMAVNEEKNLNLPVAMASAFGGGMGVASTCGAITGALMALGAVKGRETAEEKNIARVSAKEFMNKVNEKYGTYECKELKRKGVSCPEIIEYAHEVMKEYIK
ncbi:C-GCAxxG-C-C family (seleno)protein [Clostridium cellulovorans]|uniref:C_GCAxxG_C_C family protein n=1 Tax=Clostridium cellulovorans (strain ATCC 35296 / DSM 3052 / OCM 3 / 743B) TaxID=573061 RepID=D9SPI6_CLOC7|nr:C-GCAxxG-C-C family (seleno)protein [Clostridium cellulovorans]ADL50035.1 C_GCAxxG_C_C family protein [Clostridium cellulovorans 743B]